MRQTEIYVGLNDSLVRTQLFETNKYLSILKNVCFSYNVAFSVHTVDGGYFHEDGTYVEERTLVLKLMDVPDETVKEIAKDLCVFFHQESVMVTSASAEVQFVKEKL